MAQATLLDLIERQRGFGRTTAFRYHTEFRTFESSYNQAYASACQVAVLLRQQGLQPGDRAVLWAPNSPMWPAIFFGCQLAGVAVVPADLRSRPEFVRAIGQETEARLVFRTRYKRDPGLQVPTCLVEDLAVGLDTNVPPDFSPYPARPETVAEIVYTSGTTGRPKGVVLTHGNLAANLHALDPVVPRRPDLRLLSLLPLSHIFAQAVDLFIATLRGATVVYVETLRPTAIRSALQRDRIVGLAMVPRLLELLRDDLLREVERLPSGIAVLERLRQLARVVPFAHRRLVFWPLHRALGGCLDYLVVGGARLAPELEQFWDDLGFLVLQGYGLTETAPVVACNRPDERRRGSVGKPLAEVAARIAQNSEILVRGPNVTPGYFRNPVANEESFTNGWLKTGDLGHFDRDGFLYIDGRTKDVIVTTAGLNVYPEDIEAVLDRLPSVRASAVLEWQERIHAVLVPAEPRQFDARAAIEEANRHLESAQQIQGYTVWPEPDFPRTPTLKVRKPEVRRALEAMAAGRPLPAGEPLIAPSSVQQVVARVAGRPAGAVREDQTLGPDLGLSSIDLLELALLIEQELNRELDETVLTGALTVGELERLVQGGARRAQGVRPARWTRSRPARRIRRLVQDALIFPAFRAVCKLRVEGGEHLADEAEPLILAANHTSHLDTLAILSALPSRLRERVAVAAWAEFFEPPPGRPLDALGLWLAYQFVVLAVHVFPVPHRRGAGASLRYAGELLDEGWSVLVFPEGQMTRADAIGEFHEGIGLLAMRTRLPVVPIRVAGLAEILPPDARIPRPRRGLVRFGPPRLYVRGSYLEATRDIEHAVQAL